MRISAAGGINFISRPVQMQSAKKVDNQEKTSVSRPEQRLNVYKTTGIAISGLSLIGAGIYLIHRKNLKAAKNIFTPLPDTLLAKSLPENIQGELSYNHKYERFLEFLNNPPAENVSGTGANSVVYNIPVLDNYVLKILKPQAYIDPDTLPINMFPDNVNLGQPVWIHPQNFRIMLLKKVFGEPHSIKNWSSTIWDPGIKKGVPVSEQQSLRYYNQVTKIANMPQSTFDNLALQIKILDNAGKTPASVMTGFKIDSINPNNLMVDYKNNRLNVIDYFAKNKPQHQNSYLDMVAVITDFTLFREYYDLLTPQMQKKLIKAIKTIDKKSFSAAVKTELDTDEKKFTDFIKFIDKLFPVANVTGRNGKEYIRQYGVSANYMIELLKSIRCNPEI